MFKKKTALHIHRGMSHQWATTVIIFSDNSIKLVVQNSLNILKVGYYYNIPKNWTLNINYNYYIVMYI